MQRRSFLLATLASAAATSVAAAESKNVAAPPVRVLAYGDSNTWGLMPVPADGDLVRYPEAARWTSVLTRALGAGVEVCVNGLMARTLATDLEKGPFGVDGQDFNGRRRLPLALLIERPIHLVVVMLGTNDLIAGLARAPEDVAKGVADYAAIVASSTEAHPRITGPRLLLVAPQPLGDASRGGFAEDFNAGSVAKSKPLTAALKDHAAASGIAFADAADWITSDGVDGVHLSETMQRRLGEGVAKRVRQLMT